MNISNAELALINGDLNLINSSITLASGTSLNLVGELTIGQSGGTITGQGAMTLSGTTGLVINTSTISSAGDITLASSTSNITTAGAITLESTGAINLNNDFIASGAIVLKSNGLTIGGSTLSSGTASTTIQTNLANATIGLGTSNCGGTCGLSLTSTELGKITAGNLIVGDSTNGNITLDGIASTDTDQFTSVTLNATSSGSSVIFENSDSTFQAVTVNAGNGITLSSNLTTNGTTSFDSDSDANGSGIFTISAGQTLNTSSNSLSVSSSNMALGSGSAINSGTATLLISQSAQAIGLGSGAGSFSLDNTELSQITATDLIIGNSSNGTITVDNVTSFSGPLTLNATAAGSSVNFSGTASSGLGNITINAGTGGVGFGVDLTTTGSLTATSEGAIVGTGILNVAGTASFNTSGSANATVVSNSDLTLGKSTIGGDLTVTVTGTNSLNVSGNVTTSGNIIAKAESSGGAITMATGGSFNAGTGTINLSADQDITLGLLTTS
ncbi:MAG TPA: hypothetical protein DE038_04140, partial [Nitrospina sp.]|nr:hypothetical protein [Nitrospina sp.]